MGTLSSLVLVSLGIDIGLVVLGREPMTTTLTVLAITALLWQQVLPDWGKIVSDGGLRIVHPHKIRRRLVEITVFSIGYFQTIVVVALTHLALVWGLLELTF